MWAGQYALCTAISSAGIYLASRYGLTQSREQVPLTALYLGNEGKVELPERGKMVEGKGWRLRNSRDSYTLTLDNAVIENTVMESTESSHPAIDITGDLTIELKEGSGSWIRSEGAGIRGKGSLDIEAKTAGILGNRTENSQAALRLEGGQLDIKGTYAGISCPEVDIAGGTGTVSALGQCGIGIYSCRIKVEESEGEMLAGGSGEMKPSIKSDGKVTAGPGDVRVVEFDAVRPEHMAGHEEEIGGWMGGTHSALLTYSTEDMVTYNEDTSCFDGSARTLRFAAE